MLQIKGICKEYRTGSLVQKALDHVSLNLRDNEFVAVLGPSGSGKTTLLNIIGGLDQYDEGNLIINGISTDQYKDRDWDSYRNHTIGFVFQSYNLIPHQTILSNVELALTISGINASERKERAKHALEQVGLGDQLHKKPNQLSGGQMQRVAIARALVNDPDILLADEPTGALDSETSVQVMELLKEVASDRLVVMVTHNPELAEQYATRIVKLRDGKITDDSNPYEVEEGETVHKNMGKSSMSFLTSLALSFNNLWSKKTRTILVAFAGSIGIIGIALILALSNGVNDYIASIEEETLSEYPLTIQSSAFDFTSMMMSNAPATEIEDLPSNQEVKEYDMVSSVFSTVAQNDLKSLKRYLESDESNVYDYANAIEYTYAIEPEIYRLDGEGYRQVNPDQSMSSLGVNMDSTNSMFNVAMGTNVFYQLPENEELYKEQYDVMAGRWPENNHELVVVLLPSGGASDFMLYAVGLKDASELDQMIDQFMKEEYVNIESDTSGFKYKDFLDIEFKLVNPANYYTYDEELDIYVDHTSDKKYMRSVIDEGIDLKIVGVVQRKEEADAAMLYTGVWYPNDLLNEMIGLSKESEITKAQMADPDVNVLTGKEFGEESDEGMGMDSFFSIDENALANAFSFNANGFQFDTSALSNLNNIDMSNVDLSNMQMPTMDLISILSKLNVKVKQENLPSALQNLSSSYLEYASKNPSTDYQNLAGAFSDYLGTEEASAILQKDLQDVISQMPAPELDQEKLQAAITTIMNGFSQYLTEHPVDDPSQIGQAMTTYLSSPEGQQVLNEAFADVINFDPSVDIPADVLTQLASDLSSGYEEYAKKNNLPDPSKFSGSVQEYMATPEGQKVLTSTVEQVVDTEDLENQINSIMQESSQEMAGSMEQVMAAVMSEITNQISSTMTSTMSQMGNALQNAMSIDPNAFANAFKMNMTEEDFQALMMSMMRRERDSYDGNLTKFGYADLDKPTIISIYPKNFESKESIIEILDDYNSRMKKVDEDKVIAYTDVVGTLMSSVTTIVDTISYVLVAFVAISLIVSSIMIGVITYISVLERKKEIGILRAIGASKKNISEVFNAETFIIGLLAGIFGILLSELIMIPGNQLIHHLTNNPNVNAFLQPSAAIILIVLSVILTLIGGLIPSRAAAKSDPVTALRTE